MRQAACSQEGAREAWMQEAPGEGDGTRSQPSPFYVSVKMIIKWYIINDMTALEDAVNLFRNGRSSHFITALSGNYSLMLTEIPWASRIRK